MGLDVAGISSRYRELIGTCGAISSLAYIYGQDRPTRNHPSGVLQHLEPKVRGCVARPLQV